jgi:hypothetical protein
MSWEADVVLVEHCRDPKSCRLGKGQGRDGRFVCFPERRAVWGGLIGFEKVGGDVNVVEMS